MRSNLKDNWFYDVIDDLPLEIFNTLKLNTETPQRVADNCAKFMSYIDLIILKWLFKFYYYIHFQTSQTAKPSPCENLHRIEFAS